MPRCKECGIDYKYGRLTSCICSDQDKGFGHLRACPEHKQKENKMTENKNPKCSREKHWSELDQSEQIERLRSQVRMLTDRVSELIDHNMKILEHDHKDGVIIIPLDIIPPSRCLTPTFKNDEVYF